MRRFADDRIVDERRPMILSQIGRIDSAFADRPFVAPHSAAEFIRDGFLSEQAGTRVFDDKELGAALPDSTNTALTLDPAGRIAVRIQRPSVPELNSKHVALWPVVTGDVLVWKCGAPDIDPRHLSATCRERTP